MTVGAISPASGSQYGNHPFTITGTNFVDGATIGFDGVPATDVVFVESTTLTGLTPAHAPGAVTVTVTNPDTGAGTIGFTYLDVEFTPVVDAGPTQTAIGPLPSVISTDASVTDGHNNTFVWTFVSGPYAPSIGTPTTLNTTITFTTFASGTYVFKLTATSAENLSASAQLTVIMNADAVPLVTVTGVVN